MTASPIWDQNLDLWHEKVRHISFCQPLDNFTDQSNHCTRKTLSDAWDYHPLLPMTLALVHFTN